MAEDLMDEFTQNLSAMPIAPQDRVLVAVSGGPDSMALLHLFLRWNSSRVGVFHLNHGFRKEAEEDASLVHDFCLQAGIPVRIAYCDVDAYLRKSRESKQQGARRIRYNLLREHAQKHGYVWIATGHHGDDQAETVLMRLLRGSGLHGLGGIQAVRGPFIRPLLSVSREEILVYCKNQAVPYRHDQTNWRSIYLRNKIRRELIPLLEKEYNPKIRTQLRQVAELAQKDEEELQRTVQAICREHLRKSGGQLVFSRSVYNDLSLALQRRVLRTLVLTYQGHLLRIGFDHIEDWRKKLAADTTFQWQLPGVAVSANGEAIFVGSFQGQKWECQELPVPGRLENDGFLICSEIFFADKLPPRPAAAEDFAWDALQFPLIVRHRLPGDRLRPFGGTGTKKVKDLLIDTRIPLEQRDYLPLITDQNEILWIPTVRRSRAAVLRPETKKIVRLTFSKAGP